MQSRIDARPLAAALLLALTPGVATAQWSLPAESPIPYARPYAAIDNSTTTGSVPSMAGTALNHDSVARLESGLDALYSGDVTQARLIRDKLPANSLDRHILMWAIAMQGGEDVPSVEIAKAGHKLRDWPGMATLRENSERAMYREDPGPRIVLEAFGDSRPQTIEGAIILARAHLAVGSPDAARAVLSPLWRIERLDPKDEVAVIREFGGLITADDHWRRMARMLHHDRITSAQRVAGLAGGSELAEAWAAAIRGDKNAAGLLEAVPQEQHTAGYLFAKALHLRRNEGKFREAAAIMLKAPSEAASLVDPDAWWIERRVLSRELLDIDEPAIAYKIAAGHSATSPVHVADAEFHAGWYALRFLDQPEVAADHFARIAEVADGPISRGRAYYWLGRAADAGAPGHARGHYERAARYGTSFYGQLAAAKLGRDTVPAVFPAATQSDRLGFERREAVQAIRRLEATGHGHRATSLYRALAGELTSIGELALLAAMAERKGDYPLALRIGKWATARGMDVGALAHPVGAIPASAEISGAGKALAYAVARQESEFNASARSGAGALGLLQLLPGTARDMARETGLDYSKSRLTSDAGYNATLGAAYLQAQLDRFAGSYVLTFAGYNAGPSRAREWVERYGDPRGKPIDEVVDWIERIPYHETRSYVQRIMENYQVYKMRLTGQIDIVDDLVAGR